MEVLIPITFFIIVAAIVKITSDDKTKRLLIEKGLVNEQLKYLYGSSANGQVPSSLKWGMVLTAIGLAIFVGQLAPYGDRKEITMGGMFLFGGLAFIAHYFIAAKMAQKSGQDKDK
jgi:uncharacterized membrane protein YbaN (DUF454 family)